MARSRVSEALDDLISRMTDGATGEKAVNKAKEALLRGLKCHDQDSKIWYSVLSCAGGKDRAGYGLVEAGESLEMGGVDYHDAKVSPENYEGDVMGDCRTAAWHDIVGSGVPEHIASRILQMWEEHYGNVVNSARPAEPPMNEARSPKGISPKGYVQIAGDFGDAWDYGGTWFNAETGNIVHHDELSEQEWKGIEAEDVKIDPMLSHADYLRIAQALSAERDEAWESIEDEIREEKATVVTLAQKFPYYMMCVETDATIERDWAEDIADIKAELEDGEQIWASMTPAQKLTELAGRKGWHEFDYEPSRGTKAELSEILGIDL